MFLDLKSALQDIRRRYLDVSLLAVDNRVLISDAIDNNLKHSFYVRENGRIVFPNIYAQPAARIIRISGKQNKTKSIEQQAAVQSNRCCYTSRNYASHHLSLLLSTTKMKSTSKENSSRWTKTQLVVFFVLVLLSVDE